MNTEIDFNISEIHHVVKTTHCGKSDVLVKAINCYRVVYTLNSKCKFILKNSSFTAEKDTISFFRPNEEYKRIIGEGDQWEFCVIGFFVNGEMPDFPQTQPVSKGSKLEAYFADANEIWNTRSPGYKIHLKSVLNKIFYTLITHTHQFSPSNPYIEATIRYMTENIHRKITVAELADLACYSTSYYNKVFADTMGVTPIKYLNKLRIERAKELLGTGIFSAAEIAEKCGFENMYYFSNTFKKYTGITPREYKKL